MNPSENRWSMTRHERRGAIVILVVIALALAATLLVRSCRTDVVPAGIEVQRFQVEADSSAAVLERQQAPAKRKNKPSDTLKHKTRRKSGGKRGRKPSGTKPPVAPRPVDPVPQF